MSRYCLQIVVMYASRSLCFMKMVRYRTCSTMSFRAAATVPALWCFCVHLLKILRFCCQILHSEIVIFTDDRVS